MEEITDEDREGDPVAFLLQRIFGVIYTWQDRLMSAIDGWCRGGMVPEERLPTWYGDRFALRLSGLTGFGTEIGLLAVCSWFDAVETYLWLNIVLMNSYNFV